VTTSRHRRRRARPARLPGILAVALALAGLAGLASEASNHLLAAGAPPVRVSGTLPTPSPSASGSWQVAGPMSRSTRQGAPRSVPLRLSIPQIGVRTRLVRLGLNPDGTLEVPSDFSIAGWYALGPSPGERGSAVIAGHVDSKRGPAVFYRLGELDPGASLRITLADGAEVRFRVYAMREYPKAAFPTALVYGATALPEVRLVTCGGPFDERTGHYLDNVVVFARYAGTSGPAR
jgi:sortase (surface protein transpeptidase)